MQRKAAEVKGMETEKAGTQLQFGEKELRVLRSACSQRCWVKDQSYPSIL